jgi:hypothetical protein
LRVPSSGVRRQHLHSALCRPGDSEPG